MQIMKFKILLFILAITITVHSQTPIKGMTRIQKSQIERGYGMFIHFGINTFNEIEWSKGKLPVSSYNPTNLDCDQWIKVAKEAGFRYVILVTKHLDGFCLWDSKYTDYDVASSPVKTDVIAEVHFPTDLAYFNYAAFSYDNNYFGYVGKPSSNGLIHIFKLDFNSHNKTLSVVDSYLSRYPRYASWVCGFSKQGYFATYDSTPDTYIIKADEELFQNKHTDKELKENIVRNTSTIYSTYSKWIEIKGKNFLCFSPSGNFTALSEQGYEPLTLGGYGHQESGALHIASTSEGIIFDSF